jgi:hypothetical protein
MKANDASSPGGSADARAFVAASSKGAPRLGWSLANSTIGAPFFSASPDRHDHADLAR